MTQLKKQTPSNGIKMKVKKNIVLLAVFPLVFALAPTAQAVAITAPTDGYMGLYRLVFITSGEGDRPISTDINHYDQYVTIVGNTDDELFALDTDWQVLGSTEDDNIRAHTDTEATDATDIRIYNLAGVKVADNYVDFYDGSWDASFRFEDGSGGGATSFFSGTQADGTNAVGASGTLGNSRGWRRSNNLTDTTWSGFDPNVPNHNAYAGISIKVFQVPEPSTFTLFGLGGLALMFRRRS